MLSGLDIDRIGRELVAARDAGARLAEYPGAFPTDLETAYRIQDVAIGLSGKAVGGWKVGKIEAGMAARFGSDRLAGPIFASRIKMSPGDGATAMPVLPGFAAVEAELLLRIAAMPAEDATLETVRQSIDEVRFGMEIASSPFPGINEHGPAITVSDFGNNYGLLLGPEIADWRTMDLLAASVVLAIDAETVGVGTLGEMLDGPFGAVLFLARLLRKRGLQLQPGDWVSTGAITGVHRVHAGQIVCASFDGKFHVDCLITDFR